MKHLLPEYQRAADGEEYIAINVRAGTSLGRALSLGAGYYLETRYHGNFQSLGGLVRYLTRHNDPFARIAMGGEQDMEIATKFDDSFTSMFIGAMWDVVSRVEWLVKALAENKLPFVYFVNFEDGEGLVAMKMPHWFEEALTKCVSNARAGKFVKQAEKPAEEPSLLEQYVEKEVKPRRERKRTVVASGPTIDLGPGVAEVGEPGREVLSKVKVMKRVVKTPKPEPVTELDKGKAEIQLWFKRLQALSVEQKALVDQILEPFDDLICKPVPDEEIRDTHLPLMLKMLENITDKQVADSIARGVWTYVFDASYGTPEVIEKLHSYYVPEEE